MSVDTPSGPYCASLGCRTTADVWIQTEHGERPVCNGCHDDQEVLRHV